jgi:hypothetical protein
VKYFAFVILYLFTRVALAQLPVQSSAADPKAVDLSDVLDTIARGSNINNNPVSLIGCLNVGLQNSDSWEDFEIKYAGQNDYALMRFGGDLLFDTLNNPPFGTFRGDIPQLYADFDGDGVGDIVSQLFNGFYKGSKTYPYFDSDYTCQLVAHYDFTNTIIIGAIDFDEDGDLDLLTITPLSNNPYISLFRGRSDFAKQRFKFADDSLIFPFNSFKSAIVGKFGKNLKPMILVARGNGVYLIKNTTSLSKDSIVLISDSSSNGFAIKKLYATDITGGGITDLIVSDGSRLYIYKGGDDFGTYQLTAKTAFYIIPSPRLLDFGNYGFITNFGSSGIHACGDISGSGIPFLCVDAEINESGFYKGFKFFYAGGKALDSLFDAVVSIEDEGLGFMDTLHSINSSGRTVTLLLDFSDQNFSLNDLDLLVSRGCEKIPHTMNPRWNGGVRNAGSVTQIAIQATSGGGFVSISVTGEESGEHAVEIYDLLGHRMAARSIGFVSGKHIEQFTTSGFPDGAYIAVLRGEHSAISCKFIANHIMNDQSPESPVLMSVGQ